MSFIAERGFCSRRRNGYNTDLVFHKAAPFSGIVLTHELGRANKGCQGIFFSTTLK
jgi:hypothetical protein